MTLSLFRWARDRLQPFAKPEPVADELTVARTEYTAAKAAWDDRAEAGDTRGMGQAWPRLARANQTVLRLERQISGRA